MKRFVAVAALSAVVSFLAPLAVQGQNSPEDKYVVIYNLIQEAESLNESGSSSDALPKYQEAQSALQKFQGEFPNWNPRVVSFRLDYVASRITSLAGRTAAT